MGKGCLVERCGGNFVLDTEGRMLYSLWEFRRSTSVEPGRGEDTYKPDLSPDQL